MKRSQLFISGLAILALSAGVQAQRTANRTFMTGAAVVDNTSRFVPQINEISRVGITIPENPEPPNALRAPLPLMSTAPVGGINPFSRTAQVKNYPGISATGWVPADPHIAVGPNHIVCVVNSDIAFFNKASGLKTFQQGMDGSTGFFGSVQATNFVFDPKAFYDRISGRFFVVALEQGDSPTLSKILVAVSDDADPSGNWFKYRIEAKVTVNGNEAWLDYPGFAANKDSVIVSGNMFGFASGFEALQFIVIKKANLLTGGSAQVDSFTDTSAFTAQMAETADASVDKIYGISVLSTNSMRVFAFTNLTTTPVLNATTVSVPAYNPIVRNAQSTGGHQLSSVGGRLFQATYANGRLYTVHNVSVSGVDTRIAPRWYQIKTNNYPTSAPTSEMAGQVNGGTGQDQFMAGIAVNNLNDVSLIFTRSSASITADVMVSSRKAIDPAGTMSTPTQVATSAGATYGFAGVNRWGDYHSVQVDPDGVTFWGIAMTAGTGGGWTTDIVKWTVSSPIESADPHDAESVSMYEGTSATGNVTDIQVADANSFNVVSKLIKSLGHIAAAEIGFTLPDGDPLATLFVKVKMTAGIKCTGMVWLYNWSTAKYEHIKSFPLPNSNILQIQAGGNLMRFVEPNSHQVKVVVRTVSGPKGAKAHTNKVDFVQLLTTKVQN